MSMDCPQCGEPLRTSGECTSCEYGKKKKQAVMAAAHKPAQLPPTMTKQEWDTNREACMPHIRAALAKLKGKT